MLRQQYKRNLGIVIIDRMKKSCAVCAVAMKVVLYEDRSYRGGHYFGKSPLYRARELRRAIKAGSHGVSGHSFRVLNKDPKPYVYTEYW